MSQELYYTRVSTVQEANNYQRQFAPVIAQMLNAIPPEISSGVSKCCKKKRVKKAVALAPSEMGVIQTDFDKHLSVARREVTSEVEQLKIAAVATLVKSQDNLLISNPTIVTEKVQRIMDASTAKTAIQEIKSTFHEIKEQHTKAFVSHVTNAVKESSAAVGFTEIRVQEPDEKLLRVIATNPIGQNLIAEILTTNQTDIRTELIGFTDGSCKHVIRAFDDEMNARGITTKQKEQKPTLGIPQMPFAQKLLKPQRESRNRTFVDESTNNSAESPNVITLK